MRFLRKPATLLVLAALVAGGLIGWAIAHTVYAQEIISYRGAVVRQDDSGYSLIAPLLACDIGTEQAFPEFAPLKATLTSLVSQKTSAHKAEQISIYIRSLKGARWVYINGNDTYAPASLLKVFVMMAYYKEADETDTPGLLDEPIIFEGSSNANAETPGEVIPHLQTGGSYTIEQVIEQMIVYSDNDALNTLVDHFDPKTLTYFEQIFKDLQIPSPVTQNEDSLNFMSVDQYAMIFRVLFGSTYLSDEYSQKALMVLSKAHYKQGIVSGVPAGLEVAHKFGVTTVPATATTPALDELHDCGVVYYPNHPYLLCVMTQGGSFADLQTDIKDISTSAYQWLDQYYRSLPSSTTPPPPASATGAR